MGCFSLDPLKNVLSNPLDPPDPTNPFGGSVHAGNNPLPHPDPGTGNPLGNNNSGGTQSGTQTLLGGGGQTIDGGGGSNTYSPGTGNPLSTGSYGDGSNNSYYTWGGQVPLIQQLGGSQYAQNSTLPGLTSSYGSYAPQLGAGDVSTLGQALFGPNWTGSLTDLNSQLSGQANTQTNTANTSLRQGNLTDVQNMSAAQLSALQASNPQLYAQMTAQQSAAGQGLSPVNLGQSSLTANQPGVTWGQIGAAGGNSVLDSLSNRATGTGQDSLLQQQNNLTGQQLALGGQLTPDQLRDVQQSSRAGFAARGLDGTNGSVVNEALQTQGAQQAMLQQRLTQAGNVEAQNQNQTGLQNNLALGASSQQLGYGQLGTEAQSLQGNLALGDSQAVSQNYFNTLGFNQSQFQQNAGLLAQQTQLNAGLQNQGFTQGQSVVGNYSQNAFNPFSSTYTPSSQNVGLNQSLTQNAQSTTANTSNGLFNYLNPESGYTQNFYDTGLNAITGKQISDANAQAGETSAGISAAGSVAAGALALCCWVAREVYGTRSSRWLLFRVWVLEYSPRWFCWLYLRYGERFARFIHNKPRLKARIRLWMDARIRGIAHAL